jgi:hypothetical protein
LPIGLFAFRFWLLLAIPVALLSALGLWFLFAFLKKKSNAKLIIVVIVILAIFGTAGYQKFTHNNLPTWPPGQGWTSQEELNGYLWFKSLPVNTKVFPYMTSDPIITGLDKYVCSWCIEEYEFRQDLLNKTPEELHSFLRSRDYEYMVISGLTFRYYMNRIGENATNTIIPMKIDEIANSNLFMAVHQTPGIVVFKV